MLAVRVLSRWSTPVLVACVGGLAGVAAPAAGAAAHVRLVPVAGGAPGVVLADGGRAVVLKPRIRRASRRGRALRITCRDVPAPSSTVQEESATETPLSTSTRRVAVPRGVDYCVVSVTIRQAHGRTTKPIGALYRNPQGLDALYERAVAPVMQLASALVLGEFSDQPLSVERVTDALGGARVLGRRLTPLAIPAADTPVASGQLGIWSAGTKVSVTARTPGGRALYLDYDTADRAISTNVYDALDDETLGTTTTSSSGAHRSAGGSR